MTDLEQLPTAVLLSGGTLVTMDPDRRVIEDGGLLVVDDRIVAVGERAAIEAEAAVLLSTPPAACAPIERIDCSRQLIVPGFVNTHTHLFQGLLKGPGDDRPLYRWLREITVPAGAALTEEDCEAAAALGAVEAIRSGATTIVDFMYAHPRPFLADAVIRGLEPTGLRALVARGFVTHGQEHGVPPAFIERLDCALADVARLRAAHASPGSLITVGVAPCLLWMVDESGLRATREFADATDTLITYHLAETAFEVELSARMHGVPETEFLERIGFLGPDLLAVHCTKLDADADIARLRRHDVRVSHNPVSNMYLASGVAPVVAMDRAGLTIGLATDGPASNNNQNMLQVLKFAALLHKVAHEDAEAMTAPRVLEMATIGGARAVGMDREIGSLEIGKRADIAVFALDGAFVSPVHEPVSSLVYATSGSECRTVLVDGRVLMRDGHLTTIDEEAVLDRARRAARALTKRAGIGSKRPWVEGTTHGL